LRITICEMVARCASGSAIRPARYMTYGGPPMPQAKEQRDAQGDPEEREGYERHDLSEVGPPARVEAERQRRTP
jgi:hypothetical protein